MGEATRKAPTGRRRGGAATGESDGPPASRWPPATYWMKATAGVLLVLGLARLVLAVGNILVLILVSLVLAIGFQPAVGWLQRRGLGRGPAVLAMLLAGLAVVGGFLALVLPDVIRSIGGLIDAAPGFIERAQQGSGLVADLNERFDLVSKLEGAARALPRTLLGLVGGIGAFIFNALTVLILTIYFTVAMPRMRGWVANLLAHDDRQEFEDILDQSIQRVGGYVLGMIVVSVTAGVAAFLALLIIGVPYPAALAFFVALAAFIPTVGALLSAVVTSVVALVGAGIPQLIATAAFFLVYQQVENYLIHPRVMRRAIDMPVPVIIIAVLIGGSLLGVVGALLAIPTAAILKVAFRELYLEDRLARIRAGRAASTASDRS